MQTGVVPSWGLRKSTYPLGSRETLTLDAISVFGTGIGNSAQSVSLGAGLTYSLVLGTNSKESLRGVFGFPLQMTFTVGFAGLSSAAIDNSSKGIFFAIGFAIPTGSTPATPATTISGTTPGKQG